MEFAYRADVTIAHTITIPYYHTVIILGISIPSSPLHLAPIAPSIPIPTLTLIHSPQPISSNNSIQHCPPHNLSQLLVRIPPLRISTLHDSLHLFHQFGGELFCGLVLGMLRGEV